MYSTGTAAPLETPAITAEIRAALDRYWFSLMEKYARIGSTLEMVVILDVGPTRSPTCAVAIPATPSMGQYTLVQSRFSCACSPMALPASTCALAAASAA